MDRSRKQNRVERIAAYEALVAEYEHRLLRYAVRLVRDPGTAQDVVQEAFIKLFLSWRKPWQDSPRLSGWLYRVTHNLAVDAVRKESRRRDHHHKHAAEQDRSAPADRGPAFRISEPAARAAAALKTLSPREQQLVILKVYEEKTYKEIAEITGLKTGNVGYILHHAMKKLAAAMGNRS